MSPFAFAAPASASVYIICEVHGNHYCVGAPTINIGDPVMEVTTGGRLIDEVTTNGITKLKFNQDQSKCVGVDSSGINVVVRHCTDQGVDWLKADDVGGNNWINNRFQKDLTGRNDGGQFVIKDAGCTNSCFQLFAND
jgi:hypothetical protein